MNIGENIKAIAKMKGITLKKVAKKAGMPYTTLHSMIARNSNRGDFEVVQKIANALDVTLYDLTGIVELINDQLEKPESDVETKNADVCECVYCHYMFSGRTACNADMDTRYVVCPQCTKKMEVFLTTEYVCRSINREKE